MTIHMDDIETLKLRKRIQDLIDEYKIEIERMEKCIIEDSKNDPNGYFRKIFEYNNFVENLENILK